MEEGGEGTPVCSTHGMEESGEGAPCGGDPGWLKPCPLKLTLCGMTGSAAGGGWNCSSEWPGANSLCRGTSTGGSTAPTQTRPGQVRDRSNTGRAGLDATHGWHRRHTANHG